ncbi:MAG: hypothetical protein SFY81_15850 [Verrucomicrobiota bacterium]|nr:hypothetical protein [Verrucomicrobiota bacterium]
MTPEAPKPLLPQPFTFGGVAALAQLRIGRVFGYALAIAFTTAVVTVLIFARTIAPVIDEAISQLPDDAQIAHGRLAWPDLASQRLAGNRCFAVNVRIMGEPEGVPADFQMELRTDEFRFHSIAGYLPLAYPTGTISLSQAEMGPRWGAWKPVLLALSGLAMFIWLFLSWIFLATIYCGFVFSFVLFADRKLTLIGSWKLAFAALMPGAILMTVALLFYGFQMIGLLEIGMASVLHFVIPWFYLLFSPAKLPKSEIFQPFGPGSATKATADHPTPSLGRPKKADPNPFRN